MFSVHPLYSSSSGNMFHIASSSTNILIDVGVSYKAINEGLKTIGLTIKDIDAILITHEHSDHIKGLPLICRKNDIPIYACGDTAKFLKEELDSKNIPANIITTHYDSPFKIKDITIYPFETSHDAAMPCGYKISDDTSSITFATDLGYISNDVMDKLVESDYTILESNYDEAMLEFGKYPFLLKRRIKSVTGHLSNDACGQAVAQLAKQGHNRFLFAHLSENNNNEELAKQTIESILCQNGIDPNQVELNFASKTLSSEEYIIC